MRKLHILLLMTAVLLLTLPVSAKTILHYTFDDGDDPYIDFSEGNATAVGDGNAMPDSNGWSVWRRAATDHSGNGNHMTTWDWSWAGFNWTAESYKGDLSMTSTGGCCPAAQTWSEESGVTGVNAEEWTPLVWTIEAIFTADANGWRTIVGRDGRYVDNNNGDNSAFYFQQVNGSDGFRCQYADQAGNWHVAEFYTDVMTQGTWYHAAAVSDGTTLTLYLKDLDADTDYITATADLSASADARMAYGDASGGDWEAGTWTFARGLYAGGHGDRYYGNLDEVVFSDVALGPGSFACFGGNQAYDPDPQPFNDADKTVGTVNGTATAVEAYLNFKAGKDPNTARGLEMNPDILTHYIYWSDSDPNLPVSSVAAAVDHVNYTDPNISYFADDLPLGKIVYWKVEEGLDDGTASDTAYPAGDPNNIDGAVWQFTTVTNTPSIITDPLPALANPVAVLTAAGGTYVDGFQWYKVVGVQDPADVYTDPDTPINTGGIYTVEVDAEAHTTTLTISNPLLADEGLYYCVPKNGITTGDPSDAVQVLTARMIGHWKLDGNLEDSIDEEITGAPAHDGTSEDPNYVLTGIDGGAVQFFGDIESFVTIQDSADFFNTYPDGYTVNAWVNMPDNTGWHAFVAKQGSGRGYIMTNNGGDAIHTLRESFNDMYSGVTVDDNSWHMVTGTYEVDSEGARLGRIYVDGNLENSSNNSGVPTPNSASLMFGAELPNGASTYIGLLDDVKIWSYALSPEDVATMYTDWVADVWVCAGQDNQEVLDTFDVNNDCRVNLEDFSLAASEWLLCQRIPTEACDWAE